MRSSYGNRLVSDNARRLQILPLLDPITRCATAPANHVNHGTIPNRKKFIPFNNSTKNARQLFLTLNHAQAAAFY